LQGPACHGGPASTHAPGGHFLENPSRTELSAAATIDSLSELGVDIGRLVAEILSDRDTGGMLTTTATKGRIARAHEAREADPEGRQSSDYPDV
jgi:hypothetical protein